VELRRMSYWDSFGRTPDLPHGNRDALPIAELKTKI